MESYPLTTDEEAERVLRERARRLARKTRETAKEETQQLVIVSLGTERVGLPAEHLAQIAIRPRTIAIPHAPPWCVGMAASRGELLTVVDLQRQQGRAGLTNGTHVAVLEGDDGLLALLIDGVVEVRRAKLSELVPHLASGPFSAMTRDLISVLDVASVFTDSILQTHEGSHS